jgi:hypothetical protein
MEEITKKLEKIDISKSKVLYYSVNFNYKDVMNLVRSVLFKSTDKSDVSGVYTKTADSYELFDGKMNEDKKKKLDSKHSSHIDKMNEDTKKTLDSKYSPHIDKMKASENFIVCDNVFFLANSEFHITTLFTGGKVHEKSADLESEVGKKVSVKVNKLAVSGNFITMGVESIKFEDGTDISYFGNDVKHITIALNKTGKKVFPKDSYTALSDGKIHDVEHTINGKTSKVSQ